MWSVRYGRSEDAADKTVSSPSRARSDPETNLDSDLFYRTLAPDAPDAIIYADLGGMIRFWNRAAERIFGYSPSEALAKSIDIIIPVELRLRHREGYREAMRTGQTRYGAGKVLAVPGMRKDGSTLPVEFTLLPFRDRKGRVVGVAAILRNATHRAEPIATKAMR
jgi:PAS domain S-box-containing protein